MFKDTYYVMVYKLALEGLSNYEIAKTIGVGDETFRKWVRTKDGIRFALDDARQTFEKQKMGSISLQDYIYGHLTPQAKKIWKEIMQVQKEPNAVLRMNRIFEKHGEIYRKHLLVHALTRSRFNASQACKKVGISLKTFDKWREEDAAFANAIDEMERHKDNFFEGAFIGLVEKGNPQATMMAARTRLKERGYGEEAKITHAGAIEHRNMFDISNLSTKLQTMILAEVRKLQKLEDDEQELIE